MTTQKELSHEVVYLLTHALDRAITKGGGIETPDWQTFCNYVRAAALATDRRPDQLAGEIAEAVVSLAYNNSSTDD